MKSEEDSVGQCLRVFFLCVCFSFRADFASQIQEESKRLNETR